MITAADGRPEAQTLSAICIAYRLKNPREIFLDMKDGTYPFKAFRLHLLGIGGNWVGPAAVNDGSPKGTVSREITEELSVEKPLGPVDDAELAKMFGFAVSTRNVEKNNIAPTQEDLDDLRAVKESVIGALTHFGDYIEFVPKVVFDRADPENNRTFARFESEEKTGDLQGFASAWIAGLDEETWAKLVRLQNKFGNLSNESISVITSLDAIIDRNLRAGFGQDRIIRDIFQGFGFIEAGDVPLVANVEAIRMKESYASYDEYLKHYAVIRRP